MNPAELASVLQFVILIPSLYLGYLEKSVLSIESIIYYKTDPYGRNQFTWNFLKLSVVYCICIFGILLMGNICIFHGCRFTQFQYNNEIKIITIIFNAYILIMSYIIFGILRDMRLIVLGFSIPVKRRLSRDNRSK